MSQEEKVREQSLGKEKDMEPEDAMNRGMSNLPPQGLMDDRFSMRIPAIHDAQHTAAKTHGHDHWKVKVLKFIHSDLIQHILMALLLADVIILFVELYLTGSYPPCHIIERDAISCCAAPPTLTDYFNSTEDHHGHGMEEAKEAETDHGSHHESHFLRFLAGSEGDHHGHHNLCVYPSVESHEFEATCDPHKWSNVHKLEEVLFIFTVTILSIFMVELLIMVLVLGKAFFCQFFYVLDLFIVSTSLGLEIAFAALHEEYLVALTGILIFGRIWRFVRIGHGLIEVASEYAAKDKKVILDYAESLEALLRENGIGLPDKSKHLISIQKSFTHHGE